MTARKAKLVKLPSRDEAIELLRRTGCDENVVNHCLAVSDLAVKMARKCGADLKLVEIGGILHDLGRSRTHSISHAVEGAEIARELGLPDELVRIIERHVGGGVSKEEARTLSLPARDYMPRTLEEKLVAHADNLFAGTRRQSVKEEIAHLIRKGQLVPAKKILKLHRELEKACGIDPDMIV